VLSGQSLETRLYTIDFVTWSTSHEAHIRLANDTNPQSLSNAVGTVLTVVGGVAVCVGMVCWAATEAGFTNEGVARSSVASYAQSRIGNVQRKSALATAQKLGTKGVFERNMEASGKVEYASQAKNWIG
jgi:hypothetical protein